MRISDWSSDVCSSDLRGAETAIDRRDLVGMDRDPASKAIAARAAAIGLEPCRVAEIGVERVDGSNPRRGRGIEAERAPIGRASGRERVCQYVSISGVAGSLKKNTIIQKKESKE